MKTQYEQIEAAVKVLWAAVNAGVTGRELTALRLAVFAAERRAGAR